MSATVTLNRAESKLAANVGCHRHIAKLFHATRTNRHGITEDEEWQKDIEGAGGEIAAAKFLQRYWTGGMGDEWNDVGAYHVRCALKPHYRLIIYDTDPDDGVFILVTGRMPTFTVRGWIYAREGKLDKYLFEGRPGVVNFYVPQSDLRPLAELPQL